MIFGSHNQSWESPLSEGVNSMIFVKGDEMADQNALVTLRLRAQKLENKDLFSKSDPFLRLSRMREDGSFMPCFKTEVLSILFLDMDIKE